MADSTTADRVQGSSPDMLPICTAKRGRLDDAEDDSATCESPVRKRPRPQTAAMRAPLAGWVAQRDRALPPAPPTAPDPPDARYLERRVRADATQPWRAVSAWLCEIAAERDLRTETLFRALALLKRVYGRMPCRLGTLQLQAATVMHVAAKQEEIYPPLLDDYVYLADHIYTAADLVATERTLLAWLAYRLLPATPYEWLDAWDIPPGPLRTRATQWILFRLVHYPNAYQCARAEPVAAAGLAAAARALAVSCPVPAARVLQTSPCCGASPYCWPTEEYATSVTPWLTAIKWWPA